MLAIPHSIRRLYLLSRSQPLLSFRFVTSWATFWEDSRELSTSARPDPCHKLQRPSQQGSDEYMARYEKEVSNDLTLRCSSTASPSLWSSGQGLSLRNLRVESLSQTRISLLYCDYSRLYWLQMISYTSGWPSVCGSRQRPK